MPFPSPMGVLRRGLDRLNVVCGVSWDQLSGDGPGEMLPSWASSAGNL